MGKSLVPKGWMWSVFDVDTTTSEEEALHCIIDGLDFVAEKDPEEQWSETECSYEFDSND